MPTTEHHTGKLVFAGWSDLSVQLRGALNEVASLGVAWQRTRFEDYLRLMEENASLSPAELFDHPGTTLMWEALRPLALVPAPSPSTAIQPFAFEGQEVRIVGTPEEPRFVVADLCDVLGIGNPSDAARPLDADEKGIDSIETPSGAQQMLTVTEPGLYALLARSRKPAARRFDRWVRHDVLPAIRKTGSYSVAPAAESREQLIARATDPSSARWCVTPTSRAGTGPSPALVPHRSRAGPWVNPERNPRG